MKYKNSYKTSVDFQPWFDSGYRFQSLHLYEELGGELARGEMRLEVAGKSESLKLITEQHTGTITLEQEGGLIYNIPVFITNRWHEKNYLDIEFVCVGDQKFFDEKHTSVWDSIEDSIRGVYPGKVDLRCDTDLQAKNLKLYQNHETDQDFLRRVCLGYKRNSIFTFGLEGLMIKETMGLSDSYGNREPKLIIHADSDFTQETPFSKKYQPLLYSKVKNIWEEKYKDVMPVNPRVLQKGGALSIVHKDYYQMSENLNYNTAYIYSDMFQEIIITHRQVPKFKIGDVVEYTRDSKTTVDSKMWPFKYYLVKSNEFFIAIDDSDYVADDGYHTKWTTKLVGLEENGKIALGSEQNPTKNDNTKK